MKRRRMGTCKGLVIKETVVSVIPKGLMDSPKSSNVPVIPTGVARLKNSGHFDFGAALTGIVLS